MMRGVRWCCQRLEYAAARVVLTLCAHMSPSWSSRFGAFVARNIGTYLPVSKVADTNLMIIRPGLASRERRKLVKQAWAHLGATIGEFPHLGALPRDPPRGAGWSIEGEEHLHAVKSLDAPIIFFSGHIGNWEMLPAIVAAYGLAFAPFYRESANPLINRLILELRENAVGEATPMFPKGAKGARAAMVHLKNNGRLGVLADQKMNDGVSAKLFGRDAMTASATASFALKYHCPIVPGVITRLGPARLHLRVEKPIIPVPTTDRQNDVLLLTQRLNDQLEKWILFDPAQWLLLHRRWPKSLYRSARTREKSDRVT